MFFNLHVLAQPKIKAPEVLVVGVMAREAVRRHFKHQMHESNCIGSRTSSVLLAVPKTSVTTKSTDFSTQRVAYSANRLDL